MPPPDPTPDPTPITPLTHLISQVASGKVDARELLPVLYGELRLLAEARLAQEAAGHTLQATALVHEAYLRLLGPQGQALNWDSRGHFFGAAAQAMRRILIDHARARQAAKRRPGAGAGPGGGDAHGPSRRPLSEVTLEAAIGLDADPEVLLDLDAALAALEAEDPGKAQLVKLRFFAGLTLEQAGRALNLAPATADRHWAFAKAWLFVRLTGGRPGGDGGGG